MLWHADDLAPFGRIDDLWSHVDDPRKPGRTTAAVSVSGEWRAEYYWLDAYEAARLRVRSDDPRVVDCDGTVRDDRATPAPWHRLGLGE